MPTNEETMEDSALNVKILRNVVYIQFVMIGSFTLLAAVLVWVLYRNVRRWGRARRYLETLRPDPEAVRWAKVERTLFESRRQLVDDQLGRVRGDLDKLLPSDGQPGNQRSIPSTFRCDDLPPPPTEEELLQLATVRPLRSSCPQQPDN